jgi:hypothetical protein
MKDGKADRPINNHFVSNSHYEKTLSADGADLADF